jgi:cytochrome c-type biogenesis protein CcmF
MGQIIIYIAFAASLISCISYFSVNAGINNLLKIARSFYHIMAVFTISSAAFLLYNILTHHFEYTYIWDHSSTKEPLNLLIATFYAGQEGSFHLWALWMSIIGIFLMSYTSKLDSSGKDRYEAPVMGIFTLLLSFLLLILIIKSPYLYVWESFPKDVQAGFIPPEGRGLNPLLMNIWMSIHPPILFTGFSLMSVPFCFAISALMKNEYDRWVKYSLPWTLCAAMVLGLAIMLGGYWAYGVLGWGGYWGWDPVENSSLVPWIICVAAIHLMISQNKTGGYKKSTLLLSILAYILVLYSTFLTRSGVLGDASVHSFVDPGQEVYLFLIIFLVIFTTGGFGLLIFRLKNLKTQKAERTNVLSRETALFIGAVTLSAAALVVFAGTSWPIIAKGTVDASFYNKMNLPLAILIVFINGMSILLRWKHSEEKQFLKSLVIPLVLASILTIIFVIIGIRDLLIALFVCGALFTFFINIELVFNVIRKNWAKAGAYIAHVGIALFFLGVVGSAKYSEEVDVSLPFNEPREALGFKMTYTGATQIPGDTTKYYFNVDVEKDGRKMTMQPVMYYSAYSEGVMKNPDIKDLVVKDLYLSPQALDVPEDFSEKDVDSLSKGESKTLKGLKIKFIDFNMDSFNRDELAKGKSQTMGADIEITDSGKSKKMTIKMKYSPEGEPDFIAIPFNDKYDIYLVKVSVMADPTIQLAVVDKIEKMNDPNRVEQPTLILKASTKPFIDLVWIGIGVMVLGFFFSIIKRKRRLLQESTKDEISSNGKANLNGNGKAQIKEGEKMEETV